MGGCGGEIPEAKGDEGSEEWAEGGRNDNLNEGIPSFHQMAPTVYFFSDGPLGHSLFQYFAAELIKKIYGYEEAKISLTINLEFHLVIDDEKFKTIVTRYLQGDPVPLDTTRDLLLMGYFQDSEFYEHEREHLRSLWNAENAHYVTRNVQVKQIVQYQSKHTMVPTAADLVVHLPLRDLSASHSGVLPIPPCPWVERGYLQNLIASLPHERLFLVHDADSLDLPYARSFESLHPLWIHRTLGDDFDFLLRAPRLVTSSSSLSWMAAFLGHAREVHLPLVSSSRRGGFDSHCTVYEHAPIDTTPNLESSSMESSETA